MRLACSSKRLKSKAANEVADFNLLETAILVFISALELAVLLTKRDACKNPALGFSPEIEDINLLSARLLAFLNDINYL